MLPHKLLPSPFSLINFAYNLAKNRSWALDVKLGQLQDVRSREETETLTMTLRRDVGTSQDQDAEIATTVLFG